MLDILKDAALRASRCTEGTATWTIQKDGLRYARMINGCLATRHIAWLRLSNARDPALLLRVAEEGALADLKK